MKLKGIFKISLFASILFLNGTISNSQTEYASGLKNALIIERLTLPVTFDGTPDEAAWNNVAPLKMIMHSPVFGKEPSENTIAKVGYDDRYLYVTAQLFYKDPGMMQSVSLKRDFMGMGGDWFGFILDTYNDKENGLMFFTSPHGLRFDATIQKDAVIPMPDQMPINLSWNTFWDVRTKVDEKGWSVEIRIPFSSLRFQEIDGDVRMGLIVHRWMPGKNETDLFPAIPPNWGELSSMKPSQAQEIILKGVKPDNPVYIAPYILAGYESNYDLNNQGTDYKRSDKPALEAGLDFKYGISNSMILDVTVNTDFAQVEADEQQVNLTRFSLYFPEKRMFFLERASVFDFALGGNSNLFYSRRIGLSDDGDPVRIYGGGRLTGRIGKWDMGFLDMQTAPLWKKDSTGTAEKILPTENFGVIRFRRQIINDNSYVGGIMTSRLGADGSYNLAYGVDGIFRLFGEDYLDLKWCQTFENGTKNSTFSDPTRITARWERRSSKGLGYDLGYSLSGEHFNPGIGFEMMDNFTSLRGGIKYGWLPGEKAILYSHSPELRLLYMNYITDGSLMSLNYNAGWSFLTKTQWMGSLHLVYNIENLKDSLEIQENEVYISPGEYKFVNFMGIFSTPATKPVYTMLTATAGQFFDGSRVSVNMQPKWNISRHLELGAIYNFDKLRFKTRDEKFINHIAGIKAMYMLDTRLSVSLYVQYNTAVHGIISNLRLRYNPKEGNDFYLVFNEGRNTNLTREVPNLPVYESRSVLLKYTYTFSL